MPFLTIRNTLRAPGVFLYWPLSVSSSNSFTYGPCFPIFKHCSIKLIALAGIFLIQMLFALHYYLYMGVDNIAAITAASLAQNGVFPHELCHVQNPCKLMAVADMDESSRIKSNGMLFESRVTFFDIVAFPKNDINETNKIGDSEPEQHTEQFKILKKPEIKLVNGYNENGRGLELSDLIKYNGKYYTADDRTGILFEMLIEHSDVSLLPRAIFNAGDGETSTKGHKIEWLAQKDGELYMGSFGKEFTDDFGHITGSNQLWVIIMDKEGRIRRENWASKYQRMRETVGATYPGYMMQEAIQWSPTLKKWIILPRRYSVEPYHSVKDELRGTNLIIFCDENINECTYRYINFSKHTPNMGFSAFQFFPGSNDTVILGIMSSEVNGIQTTYLTIFDIYGHVYLENYQLSDSIKYEGLVFI